MIEDLSLRLSIHYERQVIRVLQARLDAAHERHTEGIGEIEDEHTDRAGAPLRREGVCIRIIAKLRDDERMRSRVDRAMLAERGASLSVINTVETEYQAARATSLSVTWLIYVAAHPDTGVYCGRACLHSIAA